MNNLTTQQAIEVLEWGGYKIVTWVERYIWLTKDWQKFDLTDFNIIKALESKMCDELEVSLIEHHRDKEKDYLNIVYWDYYEETVLAQGESINPDKEEAEKESILNAIYKHVQSIKKGKE
jgi:hypothetical protein